MIPVLILAIARRKIVIVRFLSGDSEVFSFYIT